MLIVLHIAVSLQLLCVKLYCALNPANLLKYQ